MLILGRRDGQWVTVVHDASGDILRIRVSNVRGRVGDDAPRCDLGFDDPDWRFLIDRPRRSEPQRPSRGERLRPEPPATDGHRSDRSFELGNQV
jgi:hypothetical protein